MSEMNADIGAFSFSHKNTTLEERDMLALSASEISEFLPIFREHLGGEVGILSTCNRTEFYAYGPKTRRLWDASRGLLAKLKGVSPDRLPTPARWYSSEAASHLFRVSSSLESLALGEDQILAQVKDAHDLVLQSQLKSPALDQLFQFAVRAGKQVRTDTTLCQGHVSISSVSVDLAKKIYGSFKRTTILLVGAGETASNAALHFRAAGARDFIVVNRGEERGRKVAEAFGGEYMPLHRLSDACVRADIAVFATGSQTHLVDGEGIRNIMRARRNRQMLIIDISNPRNVAPEVQDQSSIFLFNIDHLEQMVEENLRDRADQIPRAEAIISSYVEDWNAWLRTRRVTPTIASLARHFSSVRQQELAHFEHKVSEEEFELLKEFSQRLVKKLQHNPIMFLRRSVEDNTLRSEDIDLVLALHNLGSDQDADS